MRVQKLEKELTEKSVARGLSSMVAEPSLAAEEAAAQFLDGSRGMMC